MTRTNAITRSIITRLQLDGHVAWRSNTGGVFDPRTGRFRTIAKGSAGIGDVVAVLRPTGRHLEVEVKQGKDELRPSQITHGHAVRRAGGVHVTVHSTDEFLEWYKKYSYAFESH